MPAELHKGIALDDELRKATVALQNAADKLTKLAKDFEKNDHVPVKSQISALASARDDAGRAITLLHIQSASKDKKE